MQAFEDGFTREEVREYTQFDPWFLEQMWELHQTEEWLKTQSLADLDAENMRQVKQRGFSDVQIAKCVCAPPALAPHCRQFEARTDLVSQEILIYRNWCVPARTLATQPRATEELDASDAQNSLEITAAWTFPVPQSVPTAGCPKLVMLTRQISRHWRLGCNLMPSVAAASRG